ncbi:MAG: fatty acyl-AMP ligase [Proteobacteria bacterium]|nr:fatty acyl-AMP ligase [Pseudomonadota bacterium]
MQTSYRTIAEAIANVGEAWPENGFVFQDSKGEEKRYDFPDVEKETARRAAGLQSLGLEKGDRFGLIVIEPEDFVLDFLAALRVGVLPVPLYPPMSMGSLDAYSDRTARILETSKAKVLVASEKLQNVLWNLVDRVSTLEKLVRAEELGKDAGTPVYPEIGPDDLAFLQYTSGSTSDPKGVMVTHGSLIANVNGIMGPSGLDMDPAVDKGASWLPLYHDMGLIGFVIAPIVWGVEVVFIPTMRFIRRPRVWMDTIHRHRSTATFAPNFAYALITRRCKEADLSKWDLSCLKACGCGAEPIHPDTMRAFTETFTKGANLPETAVLPAYGMAEATLAIAIKNVSEPMRTIVVDAQAFEDDGIAKAPETDDTVILEHVLCGAPFPGHEVACFTDDVRLADGVEGELCVKGPSVTPGYFDNDEATASTFRNGWLHTGDLGYIVDGEVVITGRLKDLIIFNGRNIHPQSVEWVAAEVDGVRKGNAVAFSRPGANSEELIVAVETRASDTDALTTEIKHAVQREMSLSITQVVCLKPGTLSKTSSGKLQRRKTRQQFLNGTLGAEGSRAMGSNADKVTLAKHVAKSLWSRAKARVLAK